ALRTGPRRGAPRWCADWTSGGGDDRPRRRLDGWCGLGHVRRRLAFQAPLLRKSNWASPALASTGRYRGADAGCVEHSEHTAHVTRAGRNRILVRRRAAGAVVVGARTGRMRPRRSLFTAT